MTTRRKEPRLAKEEPVCTSVTASASVGGSVQIVKYEYTAKYDYFMSRTYDIPEGWSEQDVKDFQQDKSIQIRAQVEGLAEAEMEELLEQKKEMNS